MAKKRGLTKKVKAAIRENVVVAIAISSLFLNAFLLTGIIVYASTNTIDKSLYNESYNRYCVDRAAENLAEELEGAEDKARAEASFYVSCNSGDFYPYYSEAVEDYLRDLGY